jgi:DNA-binding MarR family transcriptional regulator
MLVGKQTTLIGDAVRAMNVPSASEAATMGGVEEFDGEAADRLRAAIGKLSRRLRTTVTSGGLTPSQTSVLFMVVRRGPLGLSELAEVEAMNPTMVSRITAQLCELGLISREPRPEDRRAATVAATPAGRRLRRRVHLERARVLSEYVHELEATEREALLRAIPALEVLAARVGERGR